MAGMEARVEVVMVAGETVVAGSAAAVMERVEAATVKEEVATEVAMAVVAKAAAGRVMEEVAMEEAGMEAAGTAWVVMEAVAMGVAW